VAWRAEATTPAATPPFLGAFVELKTVRTFDDVHRAQCMSHLRASSLHLRLLMNFSRPRVQIERIVWRFPEGQ